MAKCPTFLGKWDDFLERVVVLMDGGTCDFGPASDCAAAMAWCRVGDDKERAGVLTDHAELRCWPVR